MTATNRQERMLRVAEMAELRRLERDWANLGSLWNAQDTMHIVNAHQFTWCVDSIHSVHIVCVCKPWIVKVSMRQLVKLTRFSSIWKPTWSHFVQFPQSICFSFALVVKTCQDQNRWPRRTHRQVEQGRIMQSTNTTTTRLYHVVLIFYLLVLKPEWRVLSFYYMFQHILTLTFRVLVFAETCPKRLWASSWLWTAPSQVAHFEPEGNCLNDPPVLETCIEETQEVRGNRWGPCRCGILLLSICMAD